MRNFLPVIGFFLGLNWGAYMKLSIIVSLCLAFVGTFLGYRIKRKLIKREEQKIKREEQKRADAERRRREAKQRAKAERKAERKQKVIALVRKYPETAKFYFKQHWGITKSSISTIDITDNRVNTLLSNIWSDAYEKARREEALRKKEEELQRRKREAELKQKAEQKQKALTLVKRYPETAKYCFRKQWGITKDSISDTDITDEKVKTLLDEEWSNVLEKARKEENQREALRQKAERKQKVIALVRKYPETAKYCFRKHWGITKGSISDTDITDEKVKTLLDEEWSNVLEKARKEENQREEALRQKAEQKQKAIALIRQYPETAKDYFVQHWGITKTYISDADVTDDKVDVLLADEWSNLIESSKRAEIQRKKEKEERRYLIETLSQCVSSWYLPCRTRVKCFSLYNYYPTTCDWDASGAEWKTRQLIWKFKANPHKQTPLNEVLREQSAAVSSVMPKIVQCLQHFFGRNLNRLTLVCIPSSKQEITERRYKEFSRLLSEKTGMTNGYYYITVTRDGGAKHLGEKSNSEYAIDADFFRGKYVLLFDDVITSGSSMEKIAKKLHAIGAIVIGGLSIGRTRHTRKDDDPIDCIC